MAYTREQLLERGPQPERRGRHLDEIAFPLGGIGTGSISLVAGASFVTGRSATAPPRGSTTQTFFTIKVQEEEAARDPRAQGRPAAPVLPADTRRRPASARAFPTSGRSFRGEFPWPPSPSATRRCRSPSCWRHQPVHPLNDRDSSLPVAILRYQVTNTGGQPLQVTLFGNLANIIGPREGRERSPHAMASRACASNAQCARNPEYGTLVLATPAPTPLSDRAGRRTASPRVEAVAWSEQFPRRAKAPPITARWRCV